jgi:predicted DNA-binding transcriptional regulator AlpA
MKHPYTMDDQLVSFAELMKTVGLRSRTSVYRQIKFDPGFPRPLKLGTRAVRFRKSDLARYLQQLSGE